MTTMTREDTGEMLPVRVVGRSYTAELADINARAEADKQRAMKSIRRRLNRAYDEAIADALDGARLPKRWYTADDIADHLGVDLLIKARWDLQAMRNPEAVARVNEGLRRLWPVQPDSVKWAELPEEPGPRPEDFAPAPDETMPGRVPGDGIPVLAAAYRGDRRFVPDPADYGPLPTRTCGFTIPGFFDATLTCIEPPGHDMPHRTYDGAEIWPRESGRYRGPRSPLWRRVDGWLQWLEQRFTPTKEEH